MMQAKRISLVTSTCLTAAVCHIGITVTPLPVQASEAAFSSVSWQLKSDSADAFYATALSQFEQAYGESLGQDVYVLYRIVERIARANGLDENPWRLRITSDYNINAFASDYNVLTFEGGLLDQFHGDRDAIACVVGHELAHHTLEHIPQYVEAALANEHLKEAALAEAIEEVEAAEAQQQTTGIIGDLLGGLGGLIGGSAGGDTGALTGILVGTTLGAALEAMGEAERQQAVARAEEIYNEQVAELDAQYSATLQSHESEADQIGYEYIVAAGFDPAGCTRIMSVLGRSEYSLIPSFTHPRPDDRLADLQEMIAATSRNTQLEQAGKARLAASPTPLNYAISRDGGSLRVESRYGSQGIDGGFPD
jgi:predicted Zn-dependent protease